MWRRRRRCCDAGDQIGGWWKKYGIVSSQRVAQTMGAVDDLTVRLNAIGDASNNGTTQFLAVA
jgi:hypothetical protein